MQARLTASDLACRRGERLLFRGLSLKLSPGDVLHITGENGTGKTSLLPVGVVGVEGGFRRGEMVVCVGPDGREVARGLVNYAAQDAARIAGKSTDEIAGILGYIDDPEMVHKDNLVLV